MAERKVRLIDVEALWRIERIGARLALARRRPGRLLGDEPLDGGEQGRDQPLAALHLRRRAAPPHRLRREGRPGRLVAQGRRDRLRLQARAGRAARTTPPQLYLISPDGGEARRISDFAPGIEAFKWFADGKRIAFVSWVWPELKGAKAQAKRWKEWKERKESGYVTSRGAVPLLGPQPADGPGRRTCTCSTSPAAASSTCSRAPASSCSAWTRTPTSSTSRPDGRHIVFVFDPAPQKRLDNCKALAEINVASGRSSTVAIDPAWDFEAPRYSPGRPADRLPRQQHRPPPHRARQRRAARARRLLARAHRRLGPCGQRAAALVGRRQRALVHRRGPRPAAISGASRSRARARRSPPRAAGCTGSTSPATPSSPSPTR